MKKCTKCGIEKKLDEYHVNKMGAFGKQAQCKECKKNYFLRNKDKIRKKNKEWENNNKEKIRLKDQKKYLRCTLNEPACIYQIKCSINNRVYIGETVQGKMRWRAHLNSLRRNKHTNKKLQNDFNKHGESAFEWLIIKETSKDKKTLLLEEAKEIQRRINNREELYNLMLTIEQLKMLNENQEKK